LDLLAAGVFPLSSVPKIRKSKRFGKWIWIHTLS